MKLIKAKVANFGKLKDFEFDFKDGVNTLIYENGWGKTTLAVFIKTMFYGMEQTTKKLENNEKLKYKPWQGGVYGGRLSFEYKGNKFEINRSFGERAKEDFFEIIDLKTNKTSNDFDENIGEQIFGVNKDTFEKSILVVLDTTPEGSADISAKLNSLVEADDIGNFDNAVKSLDKKAKELNSKSRINPGTINKIQNKIDQSNQELIDIENKESDNARFKNIVIEENKKLEKLKTEERNLKNELGLSAVYEKKQNYEGILNRKKSLEERKSKILIFFNDKIPSNESLENIDTILKDYNTNEANLKTESVSQTEKDKYEDLRRFFDGDVPSKEDVLKAVNTHSEYNKFKQKSGEIKLSSDELEKYKAMEKKYYGKDISQEKIVVYSNKISKLQEKTKDAETLKEKNERLKFELKISKQNSSVKILALIMGLLGGIFIGLSIFLYFFTNDLVLGNIAPSASFLLGFALIGLGIFIKLKKNKNIDKTDEIEENETKLNNLIQEISTKENDIKNFFNEFLPGVEVNNIAVIELSNEFNEYQNLFDKNKIHQDWLKNLDYNPNHLENELKSFLNLYCKTSDINLFDSSLQNLNEKIKQLDSLKIKIDKHSKINENYKQSKENLDRILNQYKTDKANHFNLQVQEVYKNYNELNSIEIEKIKTEKNLKDFETLNKEIVENFENIKAPKKLHKEIEDDLQTKGDEIKTIQYEITKNQNLIEDNNLVIDKKGDIENEIENLLDLKKENEIYNDYLIKSKEFLEKAKENLDKEYSDPIREGFKKYINILGASIPLEIDTDLQVKIKGKTKNYEANYLSSGYKDLVNFCARMALVDALYKELNPCLILDDPFVNLDKDKVHFAVNLVKEIGKEKQLIYFACHDSRDIK